MDEAISDVVFMACASIEAEWIEGCVTRSLEPVSRDAFDKDFQVEAGIGAATVHFVAEVVAAIRLPWATTGLQELLPVVVV